VRLVHRAEAIGPQAFARLATAAGSIEDPETLALDAIVAIGAFRAALIEGFDQRRTRE